MPVPEYEEEKIEMDMDGIYNPPLNWTVKEKKILRDLKDPEKAQQQLLKDAIAGSAEAAKILKEKFKLTCYIREGIRII